MGVMSSLEKLFVNRFNERRSQDTFQLISDALTLPQESSLLELGAVRGALSPTVAGWRAGVLVC